MGIVFIHALLYLWVAPTSVVRPAVSPPGANFFQSNRLTQFLSDSSAIMPESAQQNCPNTYGVRILIYAINL